MKSILWNAFHKPFLLQFFENFGNFRRSTIENFGIFRYSTFENFGIFCTFPLIWLYWWLLCVHSCRILLTDIKPDYSRRNRCTVDSQSKQQPPSIDCLDVLIFIYELFILKLITIFVHEKRRSKAIIWQKYEQRNTVFVIQPARRWW